MGNSLALTVARLQKLEPLSTLSEERLEELASLSYVEKLPIGVSIFHEGDIDNQTVYLLDGDVQLTSANKKIDKVITNRQDEAKYPLDDSQPRQVSCSALCRVELIRIDNSVLDYMMMWDQLAVSEETAPVAEEVKPVATAGKSGTSQETAEEKSPEKKSPEKNLTEQKSGKEDAAENTDPEMIEAGKDETKSAISDKVVAAEVKQENKSSVTASKPEAEKTKLEESNSPEEPNPETIPASDEDRSWIRKMRHIMAFKNMPPANIKVLLEKMETILVEKDDVIVQQGSDGEFYYVLTEGEAVVTRMVELATLSPGASFGEEALVAGAKRNASVTMKTKGMLMRLSKQNFSALLKGPLLAQVSPDDAREQINKGAVWLDVRHAKEYAHSRLPKALNIPLHEVRLRLDELDKNENYICYCSTGRRGSAAAFLLAQHGFNARVLSGGIKVMAQDLVR